MRKVLKVLKKVLFIGLGVYAALFAVFFFDLDASVREDVVLPMLEELERISESFTFLGNYAVV